MFLEHVREFDLAKYFDADEEPDFRVRLRNLFLRTRETVARERKIGLEVVLLIGCLEAVNAAVNLGLGKRESLARSLGLTASQYWKRAQAGRVLVTFPHFIDLVVKGATHVSHIAIVAPKITKANADIFAQEMVGKSERAVRELVASVNRDGSRNERETLFDLRLKLTKRQLEVLDRAREVLSASGKVPSEEETLVRALEDLLEKRDPMRKAARAAQRKAASTAVPKSNLTAVPKSNLTAVPKSPVAILRKPTTATSAVIQTPRENRRKGVPAAIAHQVWERDQGCCSYVGPNGERCRSKIGVQIDHIVPTYYGQDNRLSNLRLLCREHNLSEAQRILGACVMNRFRWMEMRSELV